MVACHLIRPEIGKHRERRRVSGFRQLDFFFRRARVPKSVGMNDFRVLCIVVCGVVRPKVRHERHKPVTLKHAERFPCGMFVSGW